MKLPKVSLDSFDNPLVFLFFLSLALIPIVILIFIGAQKVGLI